MLAFLFNLGIPELMLVAAVAVMIFGRRLPDVAGRAYAHFHRARQGLDRLRRESGIDEEMRSIQRTVREAAAQARIDALPTMPSPPVGLTQARDDAPQEVEAADEVPGQVDGDVPAQASDEAQAQAVDDAPVRAADDAPARADGDAASDAP